MPRHDAESATVTNESGDETFKSLITLSTEAFKALQLLNGGAIVALLAFAGQAHDRSYLAHSAALPIVFFVAGLVLATLAYGSAYLTQFALHNEGHSRKGLWNLHHTTWLWLTFIICVLSLVAFSVDALCSVRVLATS
jgi:hypothetical protein